MTTQPKAHQNSQPTLSSQAGLSQRVRTRHASLIEHQQGPFIVGFSGGPDSLALAIALKNSVADRTELVLCHVDHRMRDTSQLEVETARNLAAVIGLPFESCRIDPVAMAATSGIGREEALRRQRYLALSHLAEKRHANTIVIAHHLLDQAETVLLHLLRGAGIGGAAGMRELTVCRIPWWETGQPDTGTLFNIWRPLLTEDPALLRSIVSQASLEPVLDPSNEDMTFSRNWIRHQVMPVLAGRYPATAKSLARYASIAATEDDYMTAESERAYENALAAPADEEMRLQVSKMVNIPAAIRRRVCARWLNDIGVVDVTFERVDAIDHLVLRQLAGPQIEVGSGRIATIVDELLIGGTAGKVDAMLLASAGLALIIAASESWELDLEAVQLSTVIDTGAMMIEVTTNPFPLIGDSATPDMIQASLSLRTIQPADRWAATGEPVINALRVNRVPSQLRQRLVALVSQHGVEAIPGIPGPGRTNVPTLNSTGDFVIRPVSRRIPS